MIENHNINGDFFLSLTSSENVQSVKVYETVDNGPDRITNYNSFSFPGNDFIRVWQEDRDGYQTRIKNYNLKKILWYNINEGFINSNERVNILTMEFD